VGGDCQRGVEGLLKRPVIFSKLEEHAVCGRRPIGLQSASTRKIIRQCGGLTLFPVHGIVYFRCNF
jgi:hypothetical protein